MNSKTSTLLLAASLFLIAGCTKEVNDPTAENNTLNDVALAITIKSSTGKKYRAVKYKAEYITPNESGKMGQTLYFNDKGNKRSGEDFVPGDPRRGGRLDITYAVDEETTSDNGSTTAQVEAAFDRAMMTWETQKCSNLNITKIPFSGNLGFLSFLLGFGGSLENVADIQHSGFLPGEFFDFLAPNGSTSILGITFTFVWADENNEETDIDRNGLADVAYREIYYNDDFTWRINNGTGIDVESVVLHEAGHGLSQTHFGKAFSPNANGKVHYAPRSVMNATYAGVQRTLLGTDKGGHCSIWANWPNR